MHFDAMQSVIRLIFVGIHLIYVTAHDFGHALGLPHIG